MEIIINFSWVKRLLSGEDNSLETEASHELPGATFTAAG